MLSFQVVNSGRGIQIYCDKHGLTALTGALERVRDTGHVHLCTPTNGGHELDEQNPWGEDVVGEVVITFGGD